MSQRPVEDPDGQKNDEERVAAETPGRGVEAVLQQPDDVGAAGLLEQRAHLAEDRLSEVLTAYRQVKTENEGFRDRVTRDVERRFDERREQLLLRFIDILDNLDRALESAEQTSAGNPLIEGLILVRTQLLQTLQKEGLERIPVLGLPFNPAFSEAVGTQPVREPEHDHVVVRELIRGYRLHGRVARASHVFVGQYDEEAPGANSTAAATADGDAGELIGADEDPAAPDLERATDTGPLDGEKTGEGPDKE